MSDPIAKVSLKPIRRYSGEIPPFIGVTGGTPGISDRYTYTNPATGARTEYEWDGDAWVSASPGGAVIDPVTGEVTGILTFLAGSDLQFPLFPGAGFLGINGDGALQHTPAVQGVKVYRALLTQSGTDAPVATVLENSLGDVVWTRLTTGVYRATLVAAFPSGKTWVPTGLGFYTIRSNDNVVQLTSYSSGVEADSVLYETAIEILVYPA